VTGLGWADVHAAARARGTTLSEGDGALVAWHYRTYLPLAVAAYEHLPFVSWIFSSPEDLGTTLSVQFVNAGLRGQYPLPLELFQADVDRTRSLLGLPLGVQTPVLGPTFRW
jgi:hypothetical protein